MKALLALFSLALASAAFAADAQPPAKALRAMGTPAKASATVNDVAPVKAETKARHGKDRHKHDAK